MSKYTIAKTPRLTAAHNRRAWVRMAPAMALGPASMDTLIDAIGTHSPPASRETGLQSENCRAFVIYCIDSGWLREVA